MVVRRKKKRRTKAKAAPAKKTADAFVAEAAKKAAKAKKGKKAKATGGTLAERREKIRSRYAQSTVVFEDDADTTPIYPTRFLRINRFLGGGLRAGAILELFGFEDSGKSTLSIALAADAQRQAPEGKDHVVLVNYEGPQPWAWWRRLGLKTDADHFTQLRPKSLEEGVADLYDLVMSGEVCAVIIDSVYAAAAKTRADMMEKWAGDKAKGAALGVEAVRWGEAWTSLKGPFQDNNVVAIAVNQMREKIETGGPPRKGWGGKPVTTPRGHALKFYAWVRLRVSSSPLLDEDGSMRKDVDGIGVKLQVIKNKTSDEARGIVRYDLVRGVGFDLNADLLALALEAGAIKHKGAGFYSCGAKKIRGKAALRAWVDGSQRVRDKLTEYVSRWLDRQSVEDVTEAGEESDDE